MPFGFSTCVFTRVSVSRNASGSRGVEHQSSVSHLLARTFYTTGIKPSQVDQNYNLTLSHEGVLPFCAQGEWKSKTYKIHASRIHLNQFKRNFPPVHLHRPFCRPTVFAFRFDNPHLAIQLTSAKCAPPIQLVPTVWVFFLVFAHFTYPSDRPKL